MSSEAECCVYLRKKQKEPIIFNNEDLEGMDMSHDDAVITTAGFANCSVQRLLVDFGSSSDIIFYDAFKMGIPEHI